MLRSWRSTLRGTSDEVWLPVAAAGGRLGSYGWSMSVLSRHGRGVVACGVPGLAGAQDVPRSAA